MKFVPNVLVNNSSIVSDDGFAPTRRQAIIWTDDVWFINAHIHYLASIIVNRKPANGVVMYCDFPFIGKNCTLYLKCMCITWINLEYIPNFIQHRRLYDILKNVAQQQL